MKIIYIFFVIILLISFESFGQVKNKSITKLTNIESSYPYWSPDGSMIVFQSNRADIDNTDIYSMTSNGKNLVRLTSAEGNDELPIWSPDGQQILFSSTRDGNYEIYIMDVDGKNQRNLSNHPSYDSHPNFSPDGKIIIFNSTRDMPNHDKIMTFSRDSNVELYEMDLDGRNVKRVTNYFSWDTYPDISPDGRKIAFRRRTLDIVMGKEIGNSEVFIANRDGSEAYNLSNHPAHDGWPAWSPDGKKIAFASDRERKENWQIYVIDIDGNNLTRITDFDSQGAEFAKPQWSPKGDKILCTRTKDGNVEIYLIELDLL